MTASSSERLELLEGPERWEERPGDRARLLIWHAQPEHDELRLLRQLGRIAERKCRERVARSGSSGLKPTATPCSRGLSALGSASI